MLVFYFLFVQVYFDFELDVLVLELLVKFCYYLKMDVLFVSKFEDGYCIFVFVDVD